MTNEAKAGATEVIALVEEIIPFLAGREPQIVGGVLADLTAIWLTTQFDKRGRLQTKRLRRQIMKRQNVTIEQLIEPNEAAVLWRRKGDRQA